MSLAEEFAKELRLPETVAVRAVDTDLPYSFHIDLSETIYQYLINRIVKESWSKRNAKDEQPARRIRTLLFQTDLIEQLLNAEGTDQVRKYRILGNLAETHSERAELVSRGLGDMLARDAQVQLSAAAAQGWVWLLNNHVYYLPDESLSVAMIARLSTGVLNFSSRLSRNKTAVNHALQVVERIALRGPRVRNVFHMATVWNIQNFCVGVCEGRWRGEEPPEDSFRSLLVMIALSYLTGDSDLLDKARPFMNGLRMVLLKNGSDHMHAVLQRLAGIYEMRSRRHLRRTGYLRPGESLCMHLGLCESSMSSDVRFAGLLSLTLLLKALRPPAFSMEPFYTSSSRAYTDQALEARLQNDSRLTGSAAESLRQTLAHRRPHALLVETTLRLVNDKDPGVRQLAVVARDSLPTHVKRQAVWSPSMHPHFGQQAQQIVQSMLILSCRGAVPIPHDLLIQYVLPFACVAVA